MTGGIEIYKGHPIFYGLGSLFLDFQGHKTLPTPSGETIAVPDVWFDSFVAVCDFQGHQLSRITLHPIALEPQAGERSGSPSLAHGERARKILERLKTLSSAFGTSIDIRGDEGVVEVSAKAARG